jgi:hypothetical protein
MRQADLKTTFKQELQIIPGVAWGVAVAVLLLWFAVAVPLLAAHHHQRPEATQFPPLALNAFLTFAGVVLGLWVLMVFYVNADSGRRQMNRWLWTLLVIFIPNAIGFIVYFLLRQPVGRPCGKCGATVRPEFTYCPVCGVATAPSCPACHRPVDAGWSCCAYCGAKLGE